jgi:hypothetical protein
MHPLWHKKPQNFKKFQHPRQFVNPFFSEKSQKLSKKSRRLKIDTILIVLSLTGWLYFLFFSPYFSIKDIIIQGSEQISEDELMNFVESKFNKNIFLLKKAKLANIITSTFILKKTEVTKIYPLALLISISERQPKLNIVYNDHIYLMDVEGVIYRDLWQQEPTVVMTTSSAELTAINWEGVYKDKIKNSKPLIIYNKNKDVKALGEKIIAPKIISDILSIYEIETISEYFKIRYITLNQTNPTQITAMVTGDTEIYFDVELDIKKQVENLRILYKEKLNQGLPSQLKYIDLRFGERVYYK